MLKRLSIKNYQSHKDTVLDFVPGLNAIVGQSQNGKTALLRAFKWPLTNRPLGTAFRSWFAGPKDNTEVHITFDDGSTIFASKGKTGSPDFTIGYPDGGQQQFRKVSKAVPEDVTALANLGDINIQDQLDPAFLVTAGKGEVSRVINEITGVDVADRWIKLLNRHKRGASATSDARKRDIKAAREDLKRYAGLDKADEFLTRGYEKYKQLHVQERRMGYIAELYDKAGAAGDKLHYIANVYRGMQNTLENLNEKRKELAKALCKLVDIAWTFECDHKLRTFDGAINSTTAKKNKLQEAYNQWVETLNEMAAMETAFQAHEQLLILQGQRDGAVTEYTQALEQAGVCPMCRSEVTPKMLARIMGEL